MSDTSAPQAELSADFTLASARRLPNVSEGHPCGRLHGHTFGVRLTVRGPIHAETGWVVDFADLAAAWAPVHDTLDHRVLNEVPGLENPTSERLAVWIWERVQAHMPQLVAVEVSETGGFRVTYRGREHEAIV
jgi:6-pyruvoyltetrahydropterin/6-carboxytetrahydropterin synthase